MRQVIVLATRNQGKVKELQEMLADFPVDIRSLTDFGPLPEVMEDGLTFDDNAYKKALFTAKALGLPALADDSGLMVETLGGAPGVHSARYAADAGVGEVGDDSANIARLLKEMTGESNRRAAFVCVLSLAVPSGPALTYEGRCICEPINFTTEPFSVIRFPPETRRWNRYEKNKAYGYTS